MSRSQNCKSVFLGIKRMVHFPALGFRIYGLQDQFCRADGLLIIIEKLEVEVIKFADGTLFP